MAVENEQANHRLTPLVGAGVVNSDRRRYVFSAPAALYRIGSGTIQGELRIGTPGL